MTPSVPTPPSFSVSAFPPDASKHPSVKSDALDAAAKAKEVEMVAAPAMHAAPAVAAPAVASPTKVDSVSLNAVKDGKGGGSGHSVSDITDAVHKSADDILIEIPGAEQRISDDHAKSSSWGWKQYVLVALGVAAIFAGIFLTGGAFAIALIVAGSVTTGLTPIFAWGARSVQTTSTNATLFKLNEIRLMIMTDTQLHRYMVGNKLVQETKGKDGKAILLTTNEENKNEEIKAEYNRINKLREGSPSPRELFLKLYDSFQKDTFLPTETGPGEYLYRLHELMKIEASCARWRNAIETNQIREYDKEQGEAAHLLGVTSDYVTGLPYLLQQRSLMEKDICSSFGLKRVRGFPEEDNRRLSHSRGSERKSEAEAAAAAKKAAAADGAMSPEP